MTQTERAIDKSRASLNGLSLYDFEDRGGLLHQFLYDTNTNCINNWRGAPPPEYYWHETAVSLIERAFREKWKFSTLATFIKARTSDAWEALPTCHPKRDAKALMFAAITVECTKWVLHHKCSLRKAFEMQKMAADSRNEIISLSKVQRHVLILPHFHQGMIASNII